MCLAIPAKVLSVKGKRAKVDFGNRQKEIFLGTVKPKVGDYILVGSGIAVQKINKKDAMSILKEWKKLK
jgi:hydrogenase expression/formation protein HypC